MKKAWEQPKLVVLSQGRPEEFVLQSCKTADGSGPNGPGTGDNTCTYPAYGGGPCDQIVPS
jgi:hypothetical protein